MSGKVAVTYWYGVPPEYATLGRYREIADAGFTIAQVSGTPEQVRRQLDWCAEVGVAGMVIDGRMPNPGAMTGDGWSKNLAAIIGDYRDHPALWGYYVIDEPGADLFAGLGKIVAELKRLDPKHPAYINLFPNYASPQQLGAAIYDEHVRRFIDEVRPPFVSWDHYALMEDGTRRPQYYPNLRCARDRSLAAGLDFWQIVLSLPHYGYRDPGEADLRWQAWTTLAYGAKGVSWFTYWTPVGEDFRNGIIGPTGDRTARYPLIRQINREILACGDILGGLKSVGVVHGGCEASDPPRYLAGFPAPGLVVGEFERPDGGAALIVANDDTARSRNIELVVRAEFSAARVVARPTGGFHGTHVAKGEKRTLVSVRLAPGDGQIVLLDRS